jgi:hypothetical protein
MVGEGTHVALSSPRHPLLTRQHHCTLVSIHSKIPILLSLSRNFKQKKNEIN